jgi:group I intron endonuclease
MTCGVYIIKNTVNGKVYIGSSQDVERRWRRHRNDLNGLKHHSRHLQRAWTLDGADAFVFIIAVTGEESELLELEQKVLTQYQAHDPSFGYNVSAIVGSRRGVKHSDEVREKMRAAAKNRAPKDDAYKARHSEAMKQAHKEGRLFSEEHRRKISQSQKGRKRSPETIQRMRDNCGSPATVFVDVDGTLMTVKEAAAFYGINESSMRKRLRTGNAVRVDVR